MSSSKSYEAYKYSMYGNLELQDDSRWATDNEMKNSLSEIIINSQHYAYGGIPLLSNGKIAYVDNTDSHSLVFGATGSKKTRLFCMPLLNILAKTGESFIATDPKGELYDRTSGFLKANGYNTVVLNFRDPSYGDAWNPLTLPVQFYKNGHKDKAVEILNDFVSVISNKSFADPFWDHASSQFIFGLLLILLECATEEEINVRSLTYLRSFVDESNDCELYDIYQYLNKQTLAAISLSSTFNTIDRTRASILVTVDQCIRIFSAQQNLSQMLSYSSFDINRIGLEKTAVFLIMPDEKNTYHFLVGLFIKQCYESLINVAQSQPGRKLPVRTNFVLDEFANIPAIPDMPSMITAARSRNIRFNLIVQSEHQLRKQYKEDAHTIKGNCDNWVFLTSRELPLLQEISELCGNRKRNASSNSEKDIPLISVSQLQRLSKERGEALVFHSRQYPYISQLADIDQYEFEHFENESLPMRDRKPVPVFDLKSYHKNISEADIANLFNDECFAIPGDNEVEISCDDVEISEEELEKRFNELFNIDFKPEAD